MDEDRTKGAAAALGGEVKDAVGGLTGDGEIQAEGKADRMSGRVQNAYGSAKDTAREAAGTMEARLGSLVKEQPVAALLAAAGLGCVLSRFTHRR